MSVESFGLKLRADIRTEFDIERAEPVYFIDLVLLMFDSEIVLRSYPIDGGQAYVFGEKPRQLLAFVAEKMKEMLADA